MGEAKWTPGPWQSQHQFDVAGECAIIGAIDGPDEGRFHYTRVCEVNEECDDFCANARLIAAAPELYDALAALLATYDHFKGSTVSPKSPIGRARAALAKASTPPVAATDNEGGA